MPNAERTCHDDPWAKEDKNQMNDNDGDFDKTLFNTYILSEIKSREDAAKQLTSVNALFFGGYLAVLMNNSSLNIVSDTFNSLALSQYRSLIPLLPFILWLLSIIFCILVFRLDINNIEVPFNTKTLIHIAYIKFVKLVISYTLTILGLIIVLAIMAFVIPPQLQSGWISLGGIATSSPSLVVENAGKTEAWLLGEDNALWLNLDGTWKNVGSNLTSDPFSAKDYNGKTHVLVRGVDNSAMDYIYDPTTSSGHWINLGGHITEGLTAAMDPTSHNLIRVAAKGGDNALWICDLDINTETYSWASLGGSLTTYPYIVFDTSGNEHILVRGFDSALWDKKGVVSGSSYTRTWCLLGGYLANAPIAIFEPGVNSHIAVFVKGGDNALWVCDVNSAGEFEIGTWYGLGGVITSDPFVVADTSANKIHAFVRGGDSALWMNTFSTNPWNPNGYLWQGIGGSILTYTPGACIGVNSQAFVLGTDHALWRSTHNTFSVDSSKLE